MRRLKGILSEIISQADMVLLALCIGATGFGLLLIASATHYTGSYRYVIVQAAALAMGIFGYAVFSLVDIEMVGKYWKWLLGFNVLIIALLRTPLGLDRGGNRAWLGADFLPVQIQPAELVKITFAILLAKQLAQLREKGDLKSFRSAAYIGGHLLALVGFYVAISGDVGSALVFCAIFCAMALVAGLALRWFAAAFSLLGGGFAFLWFTDKLPEYMKKRFIVLFDHSFDPSNIGLQQTRSLNAVGSGRIWGQGLFHGIRTQSSYSSALPARHTDFIFSVAGEELGMVGCVAIILLIALIVFRCLYVARYARSDTDRLVAVGMAGMLVFQTVENIGMCLFVMPVIGLTLPFFSYGGSSVLVTFCAMGLVSGIHKRSRPDWLRGN